MEINLLNTSKAPEQQPQEMEAATELQKSLDNIATMLIAAGARIESLESHVSFLLSQNKQYMNMLKMAKKRAASNTSSDQETEHVGQEAAAEKE